MNPLDFLQARRSVPSRQLGEPGPSKHQLDELLNVAIRVPDHGKLTPWRLVVMEGEAKIRLGERLAQIHLRKESNLADSQLQKDRDRFSFAPLIIAVIARIDVHHSKVPAQEQLLSAGCVAYNLLFGAQALGFGAQWLTGWSCYDRDAAALFDAEENEHLIAFIHIGTAKEEAPERTRPALADIVSMLKS